MYREGTEEDTGRQVEGCKMVSYIDGQPFALYSYGPQSWLAPFDALPEVQLEVQVLTLDDNG